MSTISLAAFPPAPAVAKCLALFTTRCPDRRALVLRLSQVGWITVMPHERRDRRQQTPAARCDECCCSTCYWRWQIRAHYTSLHNISHWLPAQQQIIFKIAVLALKCICDTGPTYFNDVCTPLAEISWRSNLRAAECGDLILPSTKMRSDGPRFSITAPTVPLICTTKFSANDKLSIKAENPFIQFSLWMTLVFWEHF